MAMGIENRSRPEMEHYGVPTVLAVQARKNPTRIRQEETRLLALAEPLGIRIIFVNPLTEKNHPWNNPSKMLTGVHGIFFLGSGDLDLSVDTPERNAYTLLTAGLADEALKRGTDPSDYLEVFGACLGHQWLHIRAGGSVVGIQEKRETGTTSVFLNEEGVEHPFLKNVPKTIGDNNRISAMVFGHKDSVVELGEGFEVIGWTERDNNSMTIRGDRIFTTAGHPEITDARELRSIVNISNDPGGDYAKGKLERYLLTYPLEDAFGADEMISAFLKKVSAEAFRKASNQSTAVN